ncbi:MAG: VWA domain-containing protein, partial [Bacteroidota bacterium]
MRILLFLFISAQVTAQTLPIVSTHNYGAMASVSNLKSDFRFVNHGSKTVFVLLVNVGENISYLKPTGIQPGDTGILSITYEPVDAGNFSESIKIFLSDSNKPVELKMTGSIKHIDNAMLHCATFHEPNSYQPTAPLITFTSKEETKNPKPPIDDLIVIRPPEKSDSIILNTVTPEPETTNPKLVTDSVSTPEFPVSEFAANNIVFVVDVSSSMQKDEKIELLKKSLEKLLSQMRGIDKVSIVSFSNGAELILSPTNGNNHATMDSIVQSIIARGTTNISAGFDLGVETLLQNYIS